MGDEKRHWTITEYIAMASLVFTVISTGFIVYVTTITNDVTSALNDEWQRKELEEVNARMLNLNERQRDGVKELKAEIKELDKKNVDQREFENFKYENNRRWDQLGKDMEYLRSLRRFQIPDQPVYRGPEFEPRIQK